MESIIGFPDQVTIRKIWGQLGLNENGIKDAVEAIKDWIKSQPHLPKEEGVKHEARLERWFIRCNSSLEKTKQAIDLYYTLKSVAPDMMSDWNMKRNWSQTITKLTYFIPMPKLTPEYNRVVCFGILSADSDDLVIEDWYRISLMTMEVRMCEDYSPEDIYVMDLTYVTPEIVAKYELRTLKEIEVCSLRGFNTRLKIFHIINAPQFAGSLVGLLKSVLSPEIKVYIHGRDLSELHKQIPKECLPNEYGGSAGSVADNWNPWLKKLESYGDWFSQHEGVKSVEEKRKGGPKGSNDVFGFENCKNLN